MQPFCSTLKRETAGFFHNYKSIIFNKIFAAVEHSLIVSQEDKIVFTSDKHWLHPLFELEDFIAKEKIDPITLFLRDKIAGKAAACLIVRHGIKSCHIELLSERAIPVFRQHHINFTYDHLVEHIQCRTEDLITDRMSIDEAWLFLRKRAGRVQGLAVKIDKLSVNRGDKEIVKCLDLEVGRGEQLIIHGANGSGKTTLLKTILGLVKPVNGSIQIGDTIVGSAEWKKNRSLTGYVHQENIKNSFPISAGEVVEIGLSAKKFTSQELDYRVEIAMRRTGCFHLLNHSFHELSGGEKQRVSLARCLCQNAQVLLLDEPTSFLDSEGKEELLILLKELSQNEAPTILLVSHDFQWIERLEWIKRELKGGQLC
jgi:zinc transport system ATP-binding protein